MSRLNTFPWAAVVPIGPSEVDLLRLDDLLQSVVCHERSAGRFYVVSDGADEERVNALFDRHGVLGRVLPHPRAGIGNAWLGRLTAGLVHAYRVIGDELPGHHVLKLDTDALVARSFSQQLIGLIARYPTAGMIGSVGLTGKAGTKTGNWFSHRVYRMSKLLSRWDHPPFFRINLLSAHAQARRLVRAAYANGYQPDTAPCGGAYLLTSEAIRRLKQLPALNNIKVVSEETMTEDVFFSIAVYAAGLSILEQNSPGDVFGICWKGLPADSLIALAARENAILHSVKDHGPFTEERTRAFFRELRGNTVHA